MKVGEGEGTGSEVGHAIGLGFDPLVLKFVPIGSGLGVDPPKLTFVSLRVMNNSITQISRHWD